MVERRAVQHDLITSIKLRISDAAARLDRLTDLLIDGVIDQESFELRRQNTEFELQRLREEEQRLQTHQKSADDLDGLLAMAERARATCSLGFGAEERRALIKNCVAKIAVNHGEIDATAAPWLEELSDGKSTPNPKVLDAALPNLPLPTVSH